MMYDKQFLEWILSRMINVYGEDPNVDFCRKLQSIINATPIDQHTPNTATVKHEKLLRHSSQFLKD